VQVSTLAKTAVVLCGVLVVACVLLTFEGGLFFVPSAAVLLLAALREWRSVRTRPV
jgi:hypothetical protein